MQLNIRAIISLWPTDLLLVVEAFVVIVSLRDTFPFPFIACCRPSVHHIAGQQVLPERKALGHNVNMSSKTVRRGRSGYTLLTPIISSEN